MLWVNDLSGEAKTWNVWCEGIFVTVIAAPHKQKLAGDLTRLAFIYHCKYPLSVV